LSSEPERAAPEFSIFTSGVCGGDGVSSGDADVYRGPAPRLAQTHTPPAAGLSPPVQGTRRPAQGKPVPQCQWILAPLPVPRAAGQEWRDRKQRQRHTCGEAFWYVACVISSYLRRRCPFRARYAATLPLLRPASHTNRCPSRSCRRGMPGSSGRPRDTIHVWRG
jgi:hypothetical protein